MLAFRHAESDIPGGGARVYASLRRRLGVESLDIRMGGDVTIRERVPALVAGVIALLVYLSSVAPGLTWAHDGADGGDFLAAALTAGVPHPPGYPTYQMLLRAAVALWPENPALAGNVLSALCAALAVSLLADLSGDLLPRRPWRGAVVIVSALSWALAPSLWTQAIITEAYTLNALFLLGVLRLLRTASKETNPVRLARWLCATGLAFGVGIGNHLTLLLALPAVILFFADSRRHQLPILRQLSAFFLPVLIGSAVYLYLPFAAHAMPPINWGNPSSAEGFWHVISGKVYRGLVFGINLQSIPARVAGWVATALGQFGGAWGALLALFGLWRLDRTQHSWWRITALLALLYSLYAVGYDTADSYVYLIPVWAMAGLWLGQGMDGALHCLHSAWLRSRISDLLPDVARKGIIFAAVGLLALLHPVASLAAHWSEINLRSDRHAVEFYESVLEQAAPGAVLLTASDRHTFALWYAHYGLSLRPDVVPINVSLYNYDWYRNTLRRSHPSLGYREDGSGDLPLLGELLVQLSSTTVIYRADPMSFFFDGFDEEELGVLVKLVRK